MFSANYQTTEKKTTKSNKNNINEILKRKENKPINIQPQNLITINIEYHTVSGISLSGWYRPKHEGHGPIPSEG